MSLQTSFNKNPGVWLTILSIMAGIAYLPQRLCRGLRHSTIFLELPELQLQFFNLVGVNPNHLLNFVLILLIKLIQSLIILLQFSDSLVLLADPIIQCDPFLLKRCMGRIQNIDHLFDLELVSLDLEKRFVDVILFPPQDFLVLGVLLQDCLFEEVDLFGVTSVQLLYGPAQLGLVLL